MASPHSSISGVSSPEQNSGADSARTGTADNWAVEFINAEVKRGNTTIWSHGNFSIPRGTVTAIVGTNGTGKTTMLSAELGLLPLASGELRILGVPAGKANARIGYVPQNYTEISESNITVFDFVLLGITGSRWGFVPSSRADHQAVNDILDFVNLTAQSHKRIRELSGGQRQRAAIAQALVNKPELLILDEPLANLDIASQNSIVELLSQLNQCMGMTIQVVAHDLNILLPILTGAVYLLDGHPHYSSMNNMLDSNLLTHLYGTKVEIITTPQGDMFVTHNSAMEPPSRTVHDEHLTKDAAQWHSPEQIRKSQLADSAGADDADDADVFDVFDSSDGDTADDASGTRNTAASQDVLSQNALSQSEQEN